VQNLSLVFDTSHFNALGFRNNIAFAAMYTECERYSWIGNDWRSLSISTIWYRGLLGLPWV